MLNDNSDVYTQTLIRHGGCGLRSCSFYGIVGTHSLFVDCCHSSAILLDRYKNRMMIISLMKMATFPNLLRFFLSQEHWAGSNFPLRLCHSQKTCLVFAELFYQGRHDSISESMLFAQPSSPTLFAGRRRTDPGKTTVECSRPGVVYWILNYDPSKHVHPCLFNSLITTRETWSPNLITSSDAQTFRSPFKGIHLILRQ